MERRATVIRSLKDAAPIMLAYFPLSLTFGVVAVSSGLPWSLTFLISLLVYSGGAQFMMVSMFTTFTAPMSMIATIGLVNLRHFLYGTTMGPYAARWTEPQKWVGAFALTDEVFAVTSSLAAREQQMSAAYYIPFAFSGYASWLLGTAIGAGIGSAIPNDAANILSFALPALFIALLFGGERTFAHMLSAVIGAVLACICSLLHFGSIGIIVGGIVGATIGMWVHGRNNVPGNT